MTAAIAGLGITEMGKVYGKTATDFAGEALEPAHVDVLPGGPQQVGAGPGEHHLAPGGRLQRLPEPGDIHLQGVLRTCRGMLPPQPVDKDIAGHRLVRAEDENREQCPLLLAADIEDMAVNADLDRSEQPVLDSRRGPQMQPPQPGSPDCSGPGEIPKAAA